MYKVPGWKYNSVIQAAELCAWIVYCIVSIFENLGENMKTKKQYFTISQMNTMLDISGPTLRFWESEFAGILIPLRTPGGQRRYTEEHINVLERIISLKKKGLKLSEIRNEMTQATPIDEAKVPKDTIEILAECISRAVKKEIHQFFQSSLENKWE